jgi:hypothetical protein
MITISIHLCDILKAYKMKTLSLKLDNNIFNETEIVLTKVKKSRNRYINEAVEFLPNLKVSMMKIMQFDIWIADLEPQRRTETGKVRPVLIVQTNLLNSEHPSTVVCPITTNVEKDSEILRIQIKTHAGRISMENFLTLGIWFFGGRVILKVFL